MVINQLTKMVIISFTFSLAAQLNIRDHVEIDNGCMQQFANNFNEKSNNLSIVMKEQECLLYVRKKKIKEKGRWAEGEEVKYEMKVYDC